MPRTATSSPHCASPALRHLPPPARPRTPRQRPRSLPQSQKSNRTERERSTKKVSAVPPPPLVGGWEANELHIRVLVGYPPDRQTLLTCSNLFGSRGVSRI